MIFKCKCCAEKEARIQDLKEQVSYLRTLVYSPNQNYTTPVQYEADKILEGGATEQVQPPINPQPVILTDDDRELFSIVPLIPQVEAR